MTPSDLNVEFLPLIMGRVATHDMGLLENLALRETGALLERIFDLEEEIDASRPGLSARLHEAVPGISDRKLRQSVLELKRLVNNAWEPWDKTADEALEACLDADAREALDGFRRKLVGRQALLDAARVRFDAELTTARRELARLLEDPFISEGIFLSSQKLHDAARRYVRTPPGAAGAAKWQRHLERSVLDHLSRSCAKTTPRGTLTAVHRGAWSPDLGECALAQERAERPISRRKTMVSLPIARRIARKLCQADGLWRLAIPRPNPTLVLDKNLRSITFWKWVARDEVLYKLPCDELLMAFIEAASPRRMPAAEVLSLMASRFPEHAAAELDAYYLKLGELDVLRTELEIPAGEPDGLSFLIEWLERLPPAAASDQALEELRRLRGWLDCLDDPAATADTRSRLYRDVEALLTRYAPHAMSVSQCLVVDSVSAWDLTLSDRLQDDLRTALRVYEWLGDDPSLSSGSAQEASLRLRADFPDADEVPVLATYSAIPEARTLPGKKPGSSVRELPEAASYAERLERLWSLIRERSREACGQTARLAPEDLAGLVGDPGRHAASDLKPGFGVLNLHIASHGEWAHGDYLVVPQFSNGLAQAFSRWSRLLEADAQRGPSIMDTISSQYGTLLPSSGDGGVWASVLYQGRGKLETAGWFPSYHPYEIETLGAPSSLPIEQILPLKDLYFKFEPDGRLSAWSRAGGRRRRVYPRYHGLINTAEQPMVRLLALAGGGLQRRVFFKELEHALLAERFGPVPGHLPRVVLGRVVLARETWVLRAAELHETAGSDLWENFLKFNRWRRRRRMPRFLFAHCGPPAGAKPARPTLVDAYNPILVDGLAAACRTCGANEEIWLVEMLPAPDQLWTRRGERRYAHEISVGVRYQRRA